MGNITNMRAYLLCQELIEWFSVHFGGTRLLFDYFSLSGKSLPPHVKGTHDGPVSGTFEYTLSYLIGHELDISVFDALYLQSVALCGKEE